MVPACPRWRDRAAWGSRDSAELTQAGLGQAETTCLTISKTGGLRPTLGAEAGRGGDAGAALGGLCPRARARRDRSTYPASDSEAEG